MEKFEEIMEALEDKFECTEFEMDNGEIVTLEEIAKLIIKFEPNVDIDLMDGYDLERIYKKR